MIIRASKSCRIGVARTLATVTLASLFLVLSSVSCAAEPEEVALRAASEWTVSSVESISSRISESLAGQLPLAEIISAGVEDQIRDKVNWSYSDPAKTAQDRYEVLAKANSSIRIPVPFKSDRRYDITVDFVLEVDTKSAKVVADQIDVSSLAIRER